MKISAPNFVTSTATSTATSIDDAQTAFHSAPRARAWWRTARGWIIITLVVLLGGWLVALITPKPHDGRPLDPDSTGRYGSRALARLLDQHGTTVHRTGAIDDVPAGSTIVLVEPYLYSPRQLEMIGSTFRVVVAGASDSELQSLAPGFGWSVADIPMFGDRAMPGCDVRSATVAGVVDFDDSAILTASSSGDAGLTSCYDGRVLIGARLVVLGSDGLLTNDRLARQGVAALSLNVISDDGRESQVYWLAGQQQGDAADESPWTLLPGWFPLTALWLLIVGVAAAFWQGARHGSLVTEPLPVIVRAAEVVEGQGRLYRRAPGNIAHATTVLRDASLRRVKSMLGLGRQVSDATAAAMIDVAGANELLRGPAPTTPAELVTLARSLETLEAELRHRSAAATTPPDQAHDNDYTQNDHTPNDHTPNDYTPNDYRTERSP